MTDTAPLHERQPFCPGCGFVERIDEDGSCSCGADTCGLDQILERLAARGLHVVSAADGAVLDAMAGAPADRVRYWADNATDPAARDVWRAELARREGVPG